MSDKATTSPVSRERSREIKRLSVILAARQARLLSRVDLAEMTGLPAATVTVLVRELIAEGYLIERGPGAPTTGRPREMLEFNPRAELVAAVSLEPTRISCEIADSEGALIAHRTARFGGDVVETICGFVLDLVGDNLPSLRGVAIAVPGVSTNGAVRLAPSVGLVEAWPIGASVQQRLGVPVVVDNDVNLMAAGECVAGAGADVANLLLVHVADGIGAGLVLDGKVRRGASGAAGEVGFMPLDSAPKHSYSGVGEFEARWSVNAIAEQVVALHPGRRPESPVRELIALAATSRPAREYLDEVLDAWARLILSCVCVIDPGMVLLSGAAAELDDATLEQLQRLLSAKTPAPTEVRRATLGDQAVLHGAISYALSAAVPLPTLP
ncbi:ROK family transcriptional regulator [Micromonospora sp. DT68]|uniref:ROK family transcriptional regulator n=1 Tax=Micromonospora profundi TaxID=1420889 RepID=A0AAJ6HXN2_9ACTN|nr:MULTISPECIES: ROK family transcriptional regulator [Micromonospora]NJC14907.1 putative NBD/HSP70 family sugar kinase [Micromonospora profundi]WLS46450.1 ROK family transcriptional regulator [Micromonospora profundi]